MCAVEVRGPDGTRPVKMSTKTVSVTSDKKMIWHEALQLCALTSVYPCLSSDTLVGLLSPSGVNCDIRCVQTLFMNVSYSIRSKNRSSSRAVLIWLGLSSRLHINVPCLPASPQSASTCTMAYIESLVLLAMKSCTCSWTAFQLYTCRLCIRNTVEPS